MDPRIVPTGLVAGLVSHLDGDRAAFWGHGEKRVAPHPWYKGSAYTIAHWETGYYDLSTSMFIKQFYRESGHVLDIPDVPIRSRRNIIDGFNRCA